LCRTASVLMDTYFGENNEGVEQDILAWDELLYPHMNYAVM
jgi:hypothetical protein